MHVRAFALFFLRFSLQHFSGLKRKREKLNKEPKSLHGNQIKEQFSVVDVMNYAKLTGNQ